MRFQGMLKRRRTIFMGIAAMALLLTHIGPAAAEGDEGASSAPDFVGAALDGSEYQLSELLKDGPVFLDFWTTWCKPCQIALPKLAEIHEKYEERGFTLLTIASDDQKTVSKVKPLVKSRGWKFPVVLDPKRTIGNQYSVRNYPTSFLIGQDGKIHSVHIGYRPGDEKKLEQEIVALLPAEKAAEVESEGGSN